MKQYATSLSIPERQNKKEDSKRDACIYQGRGKRIEFVGRFLLGGDGNRRDEGGVGERMKQDSMGSDNWNWGTFRE